MTRYQVWVETARGTDLYHVAARDPEHARQQMDGPDVHSIHVDGIA